MANVRLGWRDSLANLLRTEDAGNLRLLFSSIGQWSQFPLIGLRNAAFVMANNVNHNIPWTTEVSDEYQLHDGTSVDFRVPSSFRTYLAVGAVACHWGDSGGTFRELAWQLDGAGPTWIVNSPALALNFLIAPYFGMVHPGSTLRVYGKHDVGAGADCDAEAWMVFLPMGSGQG